MYLYLLFFVTSLLGLLRNYIKYKRINLFLFIRSPLLSSLIFYMIKKDYSSDYAILLSLILERWIMLILKSIISLCRNDYQKKKDKYKTKYNIKYENNWKINI